MQLCPELWSMATPTAGPEPTPATPMRTPEPGPGPVLAFQLPAADRVPAGLGQVTTPATASSDATGGGLRAEALDGPADRYPYVVLLDEHRVPNALPLHQRASALSARPGHVQRQWSADLPGDAWNEGRRHGGIDTDIPDGENDAASRSGLLPENDRPAHPIR